MDTERSVAARATPAKDGYSGVASTIGTVDRMKRCFLPGAFGDQEIQVPLLAYHDDGQPVGVSVLTPPSGRPYVGAQLTHHSRITPTSGAENFHALIRDGAIPATSIGWESHEDYLGWSALERGNPALARLAASIGVVQREDVHYFARIEILENSLVPVPANPLALLAVAGLSVNAEERAMTDALMELAGLKHVASVVPEKAAGARHSTTDQAMIQSAHDSLMNLGATCPLPAGAPEVEGASAVDPDGITGGWQQFMRGPYGSKLETRDVAGVSALVATELNKQAVSGDILTASYAVAQAMCAAFEAAPMPTKSINDLPDSDFAYIEPGGTKDAEGKTAPRELRHFPIHDAAHVRNALARLSQSPFGDKARSKVEAAAHKFGITVGSGAAFENPDDDIAKMEREVAALLEGSDGELPEGMVSHTIADVLPADDHIAVLERDLEDITDPPGDAIAQLELAAFGDSGTFGIGDS